MTAGLLFGLRPEEDLGLDSEDFDFGHDLLHIHHSSTIGAHTPELKGPKTPRGDRFLQLYGYAKSTLEDFDFPDGAWIPNAYRHRASPATLRDKYADSVTSTTCAT